MATVVSKNPYDLLGNDDGDSDTPKAPVKTVEKTTTRTTKRNADEAPASKGQAPSGGARRGPGGSEGAFRDRGAGSDRNRSRPTEESGRGGARGGRGARVRGGPGSRYPRDRDDRHTKGLPSGSEKQAAQSWGPTDGDAELKDEQAGEDMAQKEQKETVTEDAAAEGENEPQEPEDKSITLAEYQAQQAQKRAALESELTIRKANEGSKLKKEWAAAKPLVKDDDDEFISGTGGKAKRERERKTKQVLELDNRFHEADRTRGGRGGRGGGRGDFRGSGRGGSGGRGGRGDFRGGRGGGGGAPRNENSKPINTSDEVAFPSLGS